MSNLNNNTSALQSLLSAVNNLPEAGGSGEQATPVISVNSSTGLVTATAGTKSSTHQLAFQAAKTITPNTTSQIAVSSGYYTGGNITVAAVPTQSKTATPTTTAQTVTPDSGKFLSKVTVNAIPSTYIQPNGTKTITENGTYDVKNYASAVVDVASSGGGGSGELVDYSEAEDAMVTGTISTYTNGRVTKVGHEAFARCFDLTSVDFPSCVEIGEYAFLRCSSLTSASFPVCESIGASAFRYTNLSVAIFPECRFTGSFAFDDCTNLTSINLPVCSVVLDCAFWYCTNLSSISMAGCYAIYSYAFGDCKSLTEINLPACYKVGSHAFRNCVQLSSVILGWFCSTISSGWFESVLIYSSAFYNCCDLTNLTLYHTSVGTLKDSRAFQYTPMSVSTYTGSFGSIYVPASLVDTYKSATNWALYADRITAITENNISNLISFTIDEVTYQAERGMTWDVWCETTHNPNHSKIFVQTYNEVLIISDTREVKRLYLGDKKIRPLTVIEANASYISVK